MEINAKRTKEEHQTNSKETPKQPITTSDPIAIPNPQRQKRTAALAARERISTWAQELCSALECQ